MNFVKTIAIFISSKLTNRVVDALVEVAPFNEAIVDVVLIGLNEAARLDGSFNDGFDGGLLDILKHLNDDLPPALQDTQNRRFFFS